MGEMNVPLGLLGSLLFTMIGPIALLPLFSGATAGAEPPLRRRIALLAAGVAFVALAVAILVGAGVMQSAGTSRSSLVIAAGLILLLTALRNIFGTAPTAASAPAAPSLGVALKPIAIPGIVTPTGVAILILFASYFPDPSDKLAILGMVGVIMIANAAAMMSAQWFMRVVGPAPLIVLGAIFGVLQAAMAVEMIFSGFRLAGILAR